MKSEDLRKVVVRTTNDGMTSIQIAKQLRKVVSERTVRRWQHLYRTTGEIDLKAPTGIYKKSYH
jgi:transposase